MRKKTWLLAILTFLFILTTVSSVVQGVHSQNAVQGLKKHPVILVHGIFSTADRWVDEAGGKTIYHVLQDNGYDMELVEMLAYYPGPGQEDGGADVILTSRLLMEQVSALSQKSVARGGPAQVDVVVHSLGGLITRYLLGQSTPDNQGTTYTSGSIGKFIDVATPHSGSDVVGIFHDAMNGTSETIADTLVNIPIAKDIVKEAVNRFLYLALEDLAEGLNLPDPTATAVIQLDPNSVFLRNLNQPGNHRSDVDYSLLYGDVNINLEWRIFDIPVLSEEVASVGDLLVSRENASSIPHLGSRNGPNPSNYHVYGFPAPIYVRIQPKLFDTGLDIPNIDDVIEQVEPVWHSGLLTNPTVNAQILRILESDTPPPPLTQPTVPRPTPASAGTGGTSTVLLLDISGSMGDTWRGGVKMNSAKNAASDVVAMMEQESQQGGAFHNVGIATFSSGAWLDQPLTTSYAQVQSIIAGLMPTNGTNMGAGLEVANQALQASNAGDGRVIILLSDGLVNEGMSSSMILSGPVQDAVNAGTCIYTIGFGEPGDLDEDLLRRIADASGCGEYYYASDAHQLGNIYIRLRHESTGEVIAAIEGEVAQGNTTPPEPIQVPASKEELNITLSWPGSALDLIVTDPNGKHVDMLYQGASLATYGRFIYLIVKNPPPGIWKLAVFGKDVPEGVIDYNAIASVRGQRVIPPPRFEDQSITIIVVTFLAALLLALFALAMRRSSSGGRPSPVSGGARVAIRQGHGPGGWIGFRRGVLGIGRDPRNELTLHDDEVSRMHAQIRQEHGQYVIYDLNSSNGTKVNGRAITKSPLNNGDEIRVGHTVLVFNSSN